MTSFGVLIYIQTKHTHIHTYIRMYVHFFKRSVNEFAYYKRKTSNGDSKVKIMTVL